MQCLLITARQQLTDTDKQLPDNSAHWCMGKCPTSLNVGLGWFRVNLAIKVNLAT